MGHHESRHSFFVGGLLVTVNNSFDCVQVKKDTVEYIDFTASVGQERNADIVIHIRYSRQDDFHAALDKQEIYVQKHSTFYKTSEGYLQLLYLNKDGKNPLWAVTINKVFSRFNYFIYSQDSEKIEAIDAGKLAVRSFLLQHSFIHHQGLIIHAAGGVIQGKGMVFSAPSGSGKSTLSRLLLQSPQNRLFSEDRLIVRLVDDKWEVWGSPWHGESMIAENKSAPLAALIFLRQAQGNGIIRLHPSVALRRLLQTASIPWYSEEWTSKGLSVCERLLQDIPVFELAFRPDHSAVQTVEHLASEL